MASGGSASKSPYLVMENSPLADYLSQLETPSNDPPLPFKSVPRQSIMTEAECAAHARVANANATQSQRPASDLSFVLDLVLLPCLPTSVSRAKLDVLGKLASMTNSKSTTLSREKGMPRKTSAALSLMSLPILVALWHSGYFPRASPWAALLVASAVWACLCIIALLVHASRDRRWEHTLDALRRCVDTFAAFESIAKKGVRAIADVELLARGYRTSDNLTTITRLDFKSAMADYRLMARRRELFRSLNAVAACVKLQPFDCNKNDELTSDSISGSTESATLALSTATGSTTDTLATATDSTTRTHRTSRSPLVGSDDASSCSAQTPRPPSEWKESQTSSHQTLARSLSLASELACGTHGSSTAEEQRTVPQSPKHALPALSLASIRENLRSFQACRSVFFERLEVLCGSRHAPSVGPDGDGGSTRALRLFYGLFGCNDVVVADGLTLSLERAQLLVKSEEISLRAALKLDQTFATTSFSKKLLPQKDARIESISSKLVTVRSHLRASCARTSLVGDLLRSSHRSNLPVDEETPNVSGVTGNNAPETSESNVNDIRVSGNVVKGVAGDSTPDTCESDATGHSASDNSVNERFEPFSERTIESISRALANLQSDLEHARTALIRSQDDFAALMKERNASASHLTASQVDEPHGSQANDGGDGVREGEERNRFETLESDDIPSPLPGSGSSLLSQLGVSAANGQADVKSEELFQGSGLVEVGPARAEDLDFMIQSRPGSGMQDSPSSFELEMSMISELKNVLQHREEEDAARGTEEVSEAGFT